MLCYQNGSNVIFDYKCAEFGSQEHCQNKITGECNCMYNNVEYCEDECILGSGYYKVINNNKLFIPINSKED